MRHGLDTLLPPHIQLLHGPGCPVCVTPARYLDQAIAIARQPDTIVTTFGDLLRVPSESSGDLFAAKAQGADDGINYSREDLKQAIKRLTDGRGADYVFVTVGSPQALEQSVPMAAARGSPAPRRPAVPAVRARTGGATGGHPGGAGDRGGAARHRGHRRTASGRW